MMMSGGQREEQEADQQEEDVLIARAMAVAEDDRSGIPYLPGYLLISDKHRDVRAALLEQGAGGEAEKNEEEEVCGMREVLAQEPREWKRHRHWPQQTLLLRGHRSFRSASQDVVAGMLDVVATLQEEQEQGKNGRRVRQLVDSVYDVFNQLTGALASHSHYEENKLFPFLSRKFGIPIEHLLGDHEQLHSLERSAKNAYAQALDEIHERNGAMDLATARSALQAALAYDEVLVRHLAEEEQCVIPSLLSLTPPNYQRYYDARSVRQALGQSRKG